MAPRHHASTEEGVDEAQEEEGDVIEAKEGEPTSRGGESGRLISMFFWCYKLSLFQTPRYYLEQKQSRAQRKKRIRDRLGKMPIPPAILKVKPGFEPSG